MSLQESIGAQFKKQLCGLMAAIKDTNPHYIRCINPNREKVDSDAWIRYFFWCSCTFMHEDVLATPKGLARSVVVMSTVTCTNKDWLAYAKGHVCTCMCANMHAQMHTYQYGAPVVLMALSLLLSFRIVNVFEFQAGTKHVRACLPACMRVL